MSTEAPVQASRSFLDDLEPALQFIAPTEEVAEIPKGLLTCCRVQHQVDCKHHVARSLVGAASKRRWPDGTEDEWIHPHPVDLQGDVLAEPTALFAAVKAQWLMARQTAQALGAVVYEMQVAVFALDTTESARYDEVMRDHRERVLELQRERDDMTAEQIEALPFEYLGGEDDLVAMLAEGFSLASDYADRVMILPNEVGRNDRARYLAGALVEAPEREAMPWRPDPDPFPKQAEPSDVA